MECYAHQWRSQSLVPSCICDKEHRKELSFLKIVCYIEITLMSIVSSATWDTTTSLFSRTSFLHHCELQVSLRHVLSVDPSRICDFQLDILLRRTDEIILSQWYKEFSPGFHYVEHKLKDISSRNLFIRRSSPMSESTRYANDIALQSDRVSNTLLLSIATWTIKKFEDVWISLQMFTDHSCGS